MKHLLLPAMFIALAGSAYAQDATKPSKTSPDDLKWTTNPAIPKGIEAAILTGDPTQPGSVVVQRIKFSPNAVVPPHTHPYTEVITVISGNGVTFGMGEKVDPSATPDKPGTFIVNPAKNPHYVVNGNQETIIQIQFIGPGGIDYIEPTDDPRKK